MLVCKESEEEIARRYYLFLKLFHKYKDTLFYKLVKSQFWDYLYSDCISDIFNQVYAFLDLETPNCHFYEENLEKIKKRFDLKCNILEVGSGYLPSFGEKIAASQIRLGEGTITCYDPKVLMKKERFPNMKLVKRNFTEKTGIKRYDLVIGLLACEQAEVMIEKLCEENKDFYLSMCDCSRTLKGFPIEMPGGTFQSLMIEKARGMLRAKGETLEVFRMAPNETPVLVHKREE